jgi:hypothetical protein
MALEVPLLPEVHVRQGRPLHLLQVLALPADEAREVVGRFLLDRIECNRAL